MAPPARGRATKFVQRLAILDSGQRRRTIMDMTTLLIIVVVVLLLGGGGFYGRGRWY
jgi:hypothetical protein